MAAAAHCIDGGCGGGSSSVGGVGVAGSGGRVDGGVGVGMALVMVVVGEFPDCI